MLFRSWLKQSQDKTAVLNTFWLFYKRIFSRCNESAIIFR